MMLPVSSRVVRAVEWGQYENLSRYSNPIGFAGYLFLSAKSSGAEFLSAPFLSNHNLPGDFDHALLHGRSLGVHDRDAGARGVAGAGVLYRAAGGRVAADAAPGARAGDQQRSQLRGGDFRDIERIYDRGVRAALAERICGTGQVVEHVCGEFWNCGGVLRDPGFLVLADDSRGGWAELADLHCMSAVRGSGNSLGALDFLQRGWISISCANVVRE